MILFGIFGLIIGAAIQSLIVALFAMLAGKLVVKEAPSYGEAFKACFYAALANGIVSFALQMGMGEDAWLISMILGLIVAYIVYTISFHMIIGYTLGQAAGVAAVTTAILFGLIMGLAFVAGIILAASGA